MLSNTTSLDIATAIVAGYAALVATVAAAFQAFSWWRSWRTRVVVCVQPKMQMMEPGGTPVSAVVFKLINHSGHPVKITHLGTDPLKKGGHHVWFPHSHGLVVSGVFEFLHETRSRCGSRPHLSVTATRTGRRARRSRRRTTRRSSPKSSAWAT